MKLDLEVLKSLIANAAVDYRKQNVIGTCPWCGGNEFGVSIADNHRFGCFRKKECGIIGNIFKLLKKVNRLDLLKNKDNIQISSLYVKDIINEEEKVLVELQEIKPPVGFRRINTHPYLIKRGFIEEDFTYFEIGTTQLDAKFKHRVIFLIKQKKKLVATVARTTLTSEEVGLIEFNTGKRYPRYLNSYSNFEQILYGIDECTNNTDTVILVEGLMGKRNVDEKLQLREQEELKCLCTFGAKVSDSQLWLLHEAGIENIILMYDPDVINFIKKYASKLEDEFDSVKVALIQQKEKDPADLTRDEMFQCFDNLQGVLYFQLNNLQILDLK